MQNRTGLAGAGLRERVTGLLKSHRRVVEMAGAALVGFVLAQSYLFGGVAPFGVAFVASLRSPYAFLAAVGAVAGYTFSSNPLGNMKYLAAILLVVAFKWLFGDRFSKRLDTVVSAGMVFVSLGIAGVAVSVTGDATLYEMLLTLAEVLLGAGSAYFFSRTLRSGESGWTGMGRSDFSCIIVSFAMVIMGLSSITVGGLSIGRILSVVIVLLCARAAAEAGGAVAGISAGIAVGLTSGDYTYAIAAYGFGGLMAGVFGNLGRIATATAFIIVNTLAALFTKSTVEVYVSLYEIFIASVLFMLVPQTAVARFKISKLDRALESEMAAQGALSGRLGEISDVLRDIGATTREVSQRLGKLENRSLNGIYNRVADRVCGYCGMKSTCWQFQYGDTMEALGKAMSILKREGVLSRARVPKHFLDHCCKLDEFLSELNTQFSAYVAKEGVQRKVAKVREVVTDQFEGMAMMLEEVSGELTGVSLLEKPRVRRVREYFEKEGFEVEQVRCYADDYDRVTAEVTIPEFEVPKLDSAKSTLALDAILDAEFDMPYIARHQESATAVFTEKATFCVEMGAYQIPPENHRLCGDAYESILNRGGKAHFILSDGMGSGGGAAVDAHMASGLLAQLIAVGFSHEAALKMVNSALLIKSGEESLATIDVCSIDLYTGRATFYKAGAAPTFVLRGGHSGYVESTSLPAGILQGVSFDKTALTLRESDIIVMCSDGVIATGVEWIRSELKSMEQGDMQRLAEKLAMTAKVRRTDGHEDDITVIAIALRKGA